DAEGIEQIRRHLREIQVAFEDGDFSTPAFVHARDVPGTDVMAARKEHIEYRYQDLPRGGELRLVTSDPQALQAIRDFMAFQREDGGAGGMDHGAMGQGAMDHGAMDHGAMDHGAMDHGAVDQEAIDHEAMEHGPLGMGMGMGGMGMGMGGGDAAFAAD